ncbi:unnamed protein product [Rotaria sordida]|uniref:Uncharacterized protein n=1 Tax=Rotaria sordida TaxID=392033 RepID=A0A815ZTT9_9BILA|nr:unnamed protein product [Rotaria sordida]CAF1586734.1 unnamed protein product [Rotaria sordida]
MIIRQTSAPSLLATYSSTNTGGSSNGNNSRSTRPFSGVRQNSTIDINLNGNFVISDRGNERSRMEIFTRNEDFIRKISIRYIDIVAGLAITQQGNIVPVDSVSAVTVFSISESDDLIKWFDCSHYMIEPSDIDIFNNQYFLYHFKEHCLVVFDQDWNIFIDVLNRKV